MINFNKETRYFRNLPLKRFFQIEETTSAIYFKIDGSKFNAVQLNECRGGLGKPQYTFEPIFIKPNTIVKPVTVTDITINVT